MGPDREAVIMIIDDRAKVTSLIELLLSSIASRSVALYFLVEERGFRRLRDVNGKLNWGRGGGQAGRPE